MPKPHLDRLKRRHGWTGGSYRDLVKDILAAGLEDTSSTAAELSRRQMIESARRAGASKTGNLLMPPSTGVKLSRDAVLRKAAQDGDLLSDTLRDRLQEKLRGELEAFYSKPGAKFERREGRGRLDPATVDRFERAVKETLAPYCRRNGLPVPSNCRAIAETEMRGADSMAKHAYAEAVQQANASRVKVMKRWIWHPNLSRVEPRENHGAVDGKVVGLGDRFRVPLMKKGVVVGYVDMLYPHDPSAPAGEVISCHCECDYVVVPLGGSEGVSSGAPKTRYEREEEWDRNVYRDESGAPGRTLLAGSLVAKGGAEVGEVHHRKDGDWRKVSQPDAWEKVGTDDGKGVAGRPGGAGRGEGPVGAEGGGEAGAQPGGSSEGGDSPGLHRAAVESFARASGLEPEAVVKVHLSEGGAPVMELDPGRASGWYASRLDELRRDNPVGAQVSLKSPEEYKGMRLFAAGDGNALLALHGQDMVSVCARKVPAADSDPMPKAQMPDLIRVAVRQGARTADCYGTFLPDYYERFGFHPVAKLKWDQGTWDEYSKAEADSGRFKAEDLDNRKLFGKWNGGRPDYYVLVYGAPYGEDVPYAGSWDEAVAAQRAALSGGQVEKDGGRRLAGKLEFQGLPISLEHRKGGVRQGVDSDGNEWRTKMLFPYGYIRGTKGTDGDAVDCFVGDDPQAPSAFIVHTYRPGTVEYDEDKVMLGFTSAVEARRWLEAHYDRYVVQSVDEVPVEELKSMLSSLRGRRLEVTSDKDPGIEEIWDDRAVGVQRNTGAVLKEIESGLARLVAIRGGRA